MRKLPLAVAWRGASLRLADGRVRRRNCPEAPSCSSSAHVPVCSRQQAVSKALTTVLLYPDCLPAILFPACTNLLTVDETPCDPLAQYHNVRGTVVVVSMSSIVSAVHGSLPLQLYVYVLGYSVSGCHLACHNAVSTPKIFLNISGYVCSLP